MAGNLDTKTDRYYACDTRILQERRVISLERAASIGTVLEFGLSDA
jgi:hypothetical protein